MPGSISKLCPATNKSRCTGIGTQACCPPLIVIAVLSAEQKAKQVGSAR